LGGEQRIDGRKTTQKNIANPTIHAPKKEKKYVTPQNIHNYMKNINLRINFLKISTPKNITPACKKTQLLSGRNLGVCFNPPCCGGLLGNALKRRRKKLAILRNVLVLVSETLN
jgi:hypothetical protein